MTLGNLKTTITGRIYSIKRTDTTTKAGAPRMIFNTTLRLSNGMFLFVKNSMTEKALQSSYIKQNYDMLDDLCGTDLKSEELYAELYIAPDKTTGVNKFANFSSYVRQDDGTVGHSAEGFFKVIESSVDADENPVLNYTNQKGETWEKRFADVKNRISFNMYVEKCEGDRIFLTDGADEYPTRNVIHLPEGVENKSEVGAQYNFLCELVKGKKIADGGAKTDWTSVMSWDDVKGGGSDLKYESDKLVICAVPKKTGKTIEIEGAGTGFGGFASKTVSSDPRLGKDDEFPF